MSKNDENNLNQTIIWLFMAGLIFLLIMNLGQMANIHYCGKYGGVLLDTGECVIKKDLPYCIGADGNIYELQSQIIINREVLVNES